MRQDLAPFLYLNVLDRLRADNLRCLYSTAAGQEEHSGAMPVGMIGTMISAAARACAAPLERRVVVLPHLDF